MPASVGVRLLVKDYIAADSQKFGIATCEQLSHGKAKNTGRIEGFMRYYPSRILTDFVTVPSPATIFLHIPALSGSRCVSEFLSGKIEVFQLVEKRPYFSGTHPDSF